MESFYILLICFQVSADLSFRSDRMDGFSCSPGPICPIGFNSCSCGKMGKYRYASDMKTIPYVTGIIVVAISCQLGKYMGHPSNGNTGTAITCNTITQRFKQTPNTAKTTAVINRIGWRRPFSIIKMAAGTTPKITISSTRIQMP